MMGKQLNITEARHRLARRIFFGQRGELRQNYREGVEDQLGALGLALNAVVLWNSIYLDRAAKQLPADGFPVTDGLLARLSPLQFDHINFLGRYAFFRPQEAGRRPLREPSAGEEDHGQPQMLPGQRSGSGRDADRRAGRGCAARSGRGSDGWGPYALTRSTPRICGSGRCFSR
ncbi:hypothetical protein GCM10022244_13240 [Streptomyces gulbargensis]|uniref:Tn3 transposase DDE domain-containing protein n=2 Tax=Streptomyces gulbargensis TaxID=364901 RepID=A0ABP7LNZ6_9ACTN